MSKTSPSHQCGRARDGRGDDYPELPWDADDLRRFAEVVSNPTVRAAMDLCAERPDEWISIREVEANAGRTPYQVRGDLAGLTMMVKRRFARSNWPFSAEWAAGGDENAYYSMDAATARTWTEIIESRPELDLTDAPPAAPPG